MILKSSTVSINLRRTVCSNMAFLKKIEKSSETVYEFVNSIDLYDLILNEALNIIVSSMLL